MKIFFLIANYIFKINRIFTVKYTDFTFMFYRNEFIKKITFIIILLSMYRSISLMLYNVCSRHILLEIL